MSLRSSTVLGVAMMVAATACGGGGSPQATPAPVPSGVPGNAQMATVVDAVDVDTVRVTFARSLGSAPTEPSVEVTVIGVERPQPRDCVVAESDAFADEELPAGATVYLVADAQDKAPDGSLLRYLWDGDGEFYNEKVLRRGFARAIADPANQRFLTRILDAETDALSNGRGLWGCLSTTTRSGPTTTAPRATTTRPTTTKPPTTSPPTTAAPNTTVPAGRTVALGETFSLGIGESVFVPGEALTVTLDGVMADSRCRPGQQCIAAGDATLTVTMAKAGVSATLTLNTAAPRTARSGSYSVELVQLSFARPPVATLRVR